MRFLILTFSALILFASVSHAADQTFFVDLPDVPVMPGTIEQETDQLSFENASGRVVEAVASGAGTADAVVKFYQETLPELGWAQIGPNAYMRGTEVLKITPEQALTGAVRIKVAVAPKP